MNFLRSIARQNTTILVAVLAVVGLREFSACTSQLTVEEADAALVASCVLLSRAMTVDHPERLDAVIAQVCQPGRTREFISRVIAHDPEASPGPGTDWLDLDFDAPVPPPAIPTLGDAGVMSSHSSEPR